MYNRYMNKSFGEPALRENSAAPPIDMPPQFLNIEPRPPHEHDSAQTALKGLLGGIKLPEMNMDTVILLALVYFLLAEEGDNMSETMMIVGVLLVLGF